MLIEAEKTNIQILASCSLKISCFANDNDFLKTEVEGKKYKRNTVMLFDKMHNEVGKIDLTICISRESIRPVDKSVLPYPDSFIEQKSGIETEDAKDQSVKVVQNKGTITSAKLWTYNQAAPTNPIADTKPT